MCHLTTYAPTWPHIFTTSDIPKFPTRFYTYKVLWSPNGGISQLISPDCIHSTSDLSLKYFYITKPPQQQLHEQQAGIEDELWGLESVFASRPYCLSAHIHILIDPAHMPRCLLSPCWHTPPLPAWWQTVPSIVLAPYNCLLTSGQLRSSIPFSDSAATFRSIIHSLPAIPVQF